MDTPKVKPNGKEVGVFTISIDDGYCEWSFDMKLPVAMSINQIRNVITAQLGAVEVGLGPRLRKSHISFKDLW